MKKLLASKNIYVGKSNIADAERGVFARHDIKKGEIIERAPIIEVSEGDKSNLGKSHLVTYFFFFGKNKKHLALALGFGSLYNHSDSPNTVFKIKPKKKIIEFIALSNIKKDDEITFDYGGSGKADRKRPLWFETE